MGLFDNKVVLITGSGGGIGRCHALAFAREGAQVVVNDLGGARDGTGEGQTMADLVVTEIQAAGGKATANYDSVSTTGGARNMVQAALDAYGRLDVVVNNAGILRDKTLLKMEETMWDSVIDVHLKGTWAVGREAARAMVELGHGGHIINTSSVSGLVGNFGQCNYAAAKAGIYGLTRVWSMELERHGIRVNAIAPVAKTRMTEDIPGVPDEAAPEHISQAVLYLASDLSEGLTGRVLGIEGPHIFEYKVVRSAGAEREGTWEPSEIAASWDEIEYREGVPTADASFEGGKAETATDKIRRIFLSLGSHLKADKAAGWNATLHFAIEGAGDYTIVVSNDTAEVSETVPSDPTCVVTVDAATMGGMLDGSVKGQDAFMSGKIQATRIPDLMKFSDCFDLKAAASAASKTDSAPKESLGDRIRRIFLGLPDHLKADKAAGWNASIHFQMEGAGDFEISVADGAATAAEGVPSDPTCVVTVDAETMGGMLDGSVKGQDAFMSGKIQATRIPDLMKFSDCFDLKAAGSAQKTDSAPKESLGDRIRRIFLGLPDHLKADKAAGWNASIHFQMEGAGDFEISVADGTATAAEGVPSDPTCVVTVDAATMGGMLDGSVKGQDAFMSGKIQATRIPDLMKFSDCFDLKAAGSAQKTPKKDSAPDGAASGQSGQYLMDLPRAFQADRAAGFHGTFHIDLEKEPFTLFIEPEACRIEPQHTGEAQALITVGSKDWVELAEGRLDLQEATATGRIRSNHMGGLVKFGHLFDLTTLGSPKEAASPGILSEEIVGTVVRSEPVFCRPEEMIRYARSVGADLPIYTDTEQPGGLRAHPLYPVAIIHDLFRKTFTDGILSGVDISRMVHGEQRMEYFRPLRAWDLVSPRGRITRIDKKSSGEILRVEQNLFVEGELAVRIETGLFFRGPSSGKGSSTSQKVASEDSPSPLFQRSLSVAEKAPWIYAEASGDDNLIHVDPEFARAVGFPGVILQGLCTLGMATTMLVEEIADGDPNALDQVKVRFRKPVFPGDEVHTLGWTDETSTENRSLSFVVQNQDGVEVITNGQVILRPGTSIPQAAVATAGA